MATPNPWDEYRRRRNLTASQKPLVAKALRAKRGADFGSPERSWYTLLLEIETQHASNAR